MFRRRRRRSEPDTASDTDATAAASDDAGAPDHAGAGGAAADEPAGEPAKTPRPDGPLDVSEVDPDEPGPPRVDLGGLRVRIAPHMQLQVQVDERSGRGTGVTVVHEGAAVQMVAVAAPRSSGLWEQTRLQVAAEARRRGGTVTEAAGPFGTEVRIVVPVRTAEGKSGLQPSRVVGIDGPRWMLRATFLGKAISDPQAFARLVKVVRDVVVVRGDRPMAPGDLITVTAPTRPEQETPEASDGRSGNRGLWRALSRWAASSSDVHAAELRKNARGAGCVPLAQVGDRERARVRGVVHTVTLQPRAGVPALEAELYDGSDVLTLIWLGRRRIAGIDCGRTMVVNGRVSAVDGRRVMYNPEYKLLPGAAA